MSTREELESIGKQILQEVRSGLYLAMYFMGPALFGLGFRMDLNTRTIGTDGGDIRFNPRYLCDTYLTEANGVERCYMHMLMHGLFCHMYNKAAYPDGELWDLCCDIAVESVIDDLSVPELARVTSDLREEWYEKLESVLSVLTAEKLYRYFSDAPPDGLVFAALQKEFCVDDHSFWDRLAPNEKPPAADIPDDIQMLPDANLPLKETWEKMAERVRVEAEVSGSEHTGERGRLRRTLKARRTKRLDYAALLMQFAVWREELTVDPETFDPGYYHYGMEIYGDMPLIEPLEYRESRRVDELVIAIDTSASTARRHVQHFLNETMAILQTRESFFDRMQVRVVECDDVVQDEQVITTFSDLKKYADGFTVKGGYGTDFRPVFAWVDDNRRQGGLRNIRGLLYFTDGHGIYPTKATSYKSAFVFIKDEEYDDTGVPDWALKVYV